LFCVLVVCVVFVIVIFVDCVVVCCCCCCWMRPAEFRGLARKDVVLLLLFCFVTENRSEKANWHQNAKQCEKHFGCTLHLVVLYTKSFSLFLFLVVFCFVCFVLLFFAS